MSAPRWQEPNLARAPFVNERPVRRLAVALWLLFAIVGGIGVWQSLASRQDAGTRLAELVRLNNETVSAREHAVTLERDLRSANLAAQNERAEFLNRRLAERTFSWSSLLETLTQTMPRGVRLARLSPESFASERRRSSAKVQPATRTRVELRITGEAEETEAMLEFVDRLFQHPAFDRPNLSRESEKKDSKIQFELTVAYLPEVAGDLAAAAAQTAAPASGRDRLTGAIGAASPGASGIATPSGAPVQPGAAGSAAALRAAAASGRPTPTPRTGAGVPAWLAGSRQPQEAEAGAESEGSAPSRGSLPNGTGKFSRSGGEAVDGMFPAGVTDGSAGSAARPGSVPPPSVAPAAGAGGSFPQNVLPTPLRPYASSTGGGR